MSIIDIFSVLWFFLFWSGYNYFSTYWSRDNPSLLTASDQIRFFWMHSIIHRETRIMDSTLIMNLSSSPTFFASTTIFIIGGLIAAIGRMDSLEHFIDILPFVERSSPKLSLVKTVLMLSIFVYAFFRFTWSLRLYNLTAVLIGSLRDSASYEEPSFCHRKLIDIDLGCSLLGYAAKSFNDGLRGYYFALATLCWFIHPIIFILATTLVVSILYYREFNSRPIQTILSHMEKASGSFLRGSKQEET